MAEALVRVAHAPGLESVEYRQSNTVRLTFNQPSSSRVPAAVAPYHDVRGSNGVELTMLTSNMLCHHHGHQTPSPRLRSFPRVKILLPDILLIISTMVRWQDPRERIIIRKVVAPFFELINQILFKKR
ncbi:hypothetical protein OSB04_026576 [Centaurea solstitialis]|uniref:Uncharacterized protein n=1 Tax=Centaurea solstitialis TaxID=347529 RepID=A0AA38SPP6_9ASTR|nr:hypothetical protein OSB04_026576 [Centaurea solstitialis]